MALDLKKIRQLRGFTQDALAEKVGVNRLTIINIEKGKTQPTVTNAMALGDALDIDNWYDIYTLGMKSPLWRGEAPI